MSQVRNVKFIGGMGEELAARLHLPQQQIKAYALFAHCFTCTKDILAARKIADELAKRGIALLRFDFTGLGASAGDFSRTDFTSNVGDILAAADYLRNHYNAPSILIGHSLGGAAILAAAGDIKEAKAVATIGAPAEADHVILNFADHLETIEQEGAADLKLAGRDFTIRKDFITDLRAQSVLERVENMHKPLMILHSPIDNTVGVENAAQIFSAAKHPKSFVSLDDADHLLSKPKDIAYAAEMIASWSSRFVGSNHDAASDSTLEDDHAVVVSETKDGKFQNHIRVGHHSLITDEPEHVGGHDTGPSPYDFLSMALGSCTSMTIRMYADFKKIPLDRVSVKVRHEKLHFDDCANFDEAQHENNAKIDHFERFIELEGDFDAQSAEKMLKIADKCPVHKTLESHVHIKTTLKGE